MKKKGVLLMVCFCLLPALIFGQQRAISQMDVDHKQKTEIRKSILPLPSSEVIKNIDFRNVIFYEDFDGAFPNGWQNNVVSGPIEFPGWEWTDTGGAFGGQLLSTTADNGYMILDSDAYGESGVAEEANLISPAIDCSDAMLGVFFSVEHWARTYGAADISIFISTDDFATETLLYNWSDGEVNSSNGPNPVVSLFDITTIAQGQSNVKFKFNWIGEYDYWWLVDDVTIFEASTFNLTMLDPIGMGEVLPAPGNHTFTANTSVNLNANPAFGYTFDAWNQGDVADPAFGRTTITMDSDKTVQATFTEIDQELLWHQYSYGNSANSSTVVDETTEFEVADNFSNPAIDEITKIMVQGLPAGFTPGSTHPFIVRFYASTTGEPDWENPVSVQTVDAKAYFVEILSWNPGYSVFKFELDLPVAVDLQEGWVSVQSTAGTFFWLRADEGTGDENAWQRIFNPDGDPNENLAYDFMLEVWGQEDEVAPGCVAYLSPADLAENIPLNVTLTWQTSPNATGYTLYLGETLPATGIDLGDVTSYQADLDYSTTYQWKVVPYNTIGAAEDCPVWSFTTMDDPILFPPFTVDFDPFPPANWTLPYGILDVETEFVTPVGSNWITSNFGNNTANPKATKINLWVSANPIHRWFMSPPIDMSAKADEYELIFDLAVTNWNNQTPNQLGPEDYFAVVLSRDGGETWSSNDVLFELSGAEEDEINPEGQTFTIDLADVTGTIKLAFYAERLTGSTPDIDLHLGNVQVRIPPVEPIFSINPEAWDFGEVEIGVESPLKDFVITNTGAGLLKIDPANISLDGDDQDFFNLYNLDEIVSLGPNESATISLSFVPDEPRLYSINLVIDDEVEVHLIPVTGEGYLRPAGSTCGNPYIATLPLIDYADNTEIYGNDYLTSWVEPAPSGGYLNGYDFVARFTLTEPGFLSGSVAGSWTGLFILDGCPDPEEPAQVIAFAGSSTGGSITDVLMEAGTYFAIVSTWPTPNFTSFTLNLSFEPLPDCPAPVGLTATDVTASEAILGWTAVGTETSWNIEWGPSGFTQGEGTLVEGVDNPYLLAGLDAGTTYAFYVQSICNEETSEWAGPVSFTTQLVEPAPWFEGFATTTTPQGWTTTGWNIGTTTAITPVDGNYIRKNLWSSATTGTFTTINVGPIEQEMVLTFDYALANFSGPYNPPATGSGDFVVSVSTDFGLTYLVQETIENDGVAGWQTFSLDLAEFVGENVKIRIVANWVSGDYYIAFDNFYIGTPSADGITLDLKVILEGAYSPDLTELMLTQINDVLPLEQPFAPELPYFGNNNPVWYYEGDESVGEMPDNVVDWVLVELRDAAAPSEAYTSTVVARMAALLLNTGEIVSVDLNLPVFDVEISEGLYVVVYHRNHLAVMSAEALTEADGTYSWDFTQAMDKAYRLQSRSSYGDGHKELGDGVFGMYGGDGDANGQIQAQDKNNVWNLQSGLAGYYPADFDLNGQVQAQDKNNIWSPNSGNGSAVPGAPK